MIQVVTLKYRYTILINLLSEFIILCIMFNDKIINKNIVQIMRRSKFVSYWFCRIFAEHALFPWHGWVLLLLFSWLRLSLQYVHTFRHQIFQTETNYMYFTISFASENIYITFNKISQLSKGIWKLV